MANFKIYNVATWLINSYKTHILPIVSWSKGNQTMKFGQLIICNKRNNNLQKSFKNEAERLVSDLFFFLKKVLYDATLNKLCKTLDYWSKDILNFDFLEKVLGIVFPPHFVYDFSRKMFFMLYSINWSNIIV